MEAPSTGSAGHPRRSAVGPGQLLAGVELEVIIHGDVGSQHLQVQSVRVLKRGRREFITRATAWGGAGGGSSEWSA